MRSSGPVAPVLGLVLALVAVVPAPVPVAVSVPTPDPVPTPVSVSVSVSLLVPASVPEPAAGRVVGDAGTRSEAPWVWPTGGRVVERGWEAPADEYAAGHRGIDVDAAVGTQTVAVADGVVSFAGQVAGRGVVSIDHGDGLVSTLDSVAPLVAGGEVVRRGDPIGTVAVGHCSAEASCVHLGARVDGRYIDPTPYLPAAAWPVLLPESAWPG
ncbi:murein hydrolase activator EnvC [Curtobacterium sp. MCBA15_012]|uniref:murein hydrolase activator EnvC family protein n=1 Tax=Curtobacterium sp. MCBA15_012 TaxID=1898738 RepID=UPI0009F293B4|nr:M23 family metallopeptidase [Curtobacterium sp. MCBA15_012]WIA98890.1 M23 family metallopeptidase [Curtobacterium sp. MCBA15_012]